MWPREFTFSTTLRQVEVRQPEGSAWAGATGFDRRRHGRVALAAVVAVHEVDAHGSPQAGWNCQSMDISRSGIGLRSRRMIHAGRGVFVSVALSNGRRKLLYGEVRYSHYSQGGEYRVGVEFQTPPPTDEISQFLATQGEPAV